MRKILSLIIITSIILTASSFLFACNKTDSKVRVAHASLYSDNGYIDYAKEVYFDTDTYPDMEEMGLFWTRWDAETESIIQVAADSEEGASLIDPSKPTIINVHGVLMDGHEKPERFYLNSKIANPDEFDLETEEVSMLYLWMREGWNVGTFHYNRFASEGIRPDFIESKIWSGESIQGETRGMRYRHANGSYSAQDITEYSLAEHFAAEYIRAMNLLSDDMGKEEIRVAGHSMGGQVATASLFLLTELADAGQLPFEQLPNRFALLDPYFSTFIESGNSSLYMGPKTIKIRWSGKTITDNSTGITMLECLKDLEANGIVLEYYTYHQSFLKLAMMNIVEEFKTISTYSIVNPDWSGNGYQIVADGHNGVREWYLCSLLSPQVKDISNDSGEYAPSAAMPTEMIKALKGNEYILVDGSNTVNAKDDTKIRAYAIYYTLNGGHNATSNRDYYTTLTNEYVLNDPTRSSHTFSGWYTNPEFSGEPITAIDTSLKSTVRLYAKWTQN